MGLGIEVWTGDWVQVSLGLGPRFKSGLGPGLELRPGLGSGPGLVLGPGLEPGQVNGLGLGLRLSFAGQTLHS